MTGSASLLGLYFCIFPLISPRIIAVNSCSDDETYNNCVPGPTDPLALAVTRSAMMHDDTTSRFSRVAVCVDPSLC